MNYRTHLIAFADVLNIHVVVNGMELAMIVDRIAWPISEVELENFICDVLHAKHSNKEPTP